MTDEQWKMTPEIEKFLKESRAKQLEYRRQFAEHHSQRTPTFPEIDEKGEFVGFFGYLTAVGVSIYPYYQTPSGIYFYEWSDLDGENKETLRLDVEDLKRKDAAKFYSIEGFINSKPDE